MKASDYEALCKRRKLLAVSPLQIVGLFEKVSYMNKDHVQRIHFTELPVDYAVKGVTFDFSRNCFMLEIISREFEQVPDGAVAPMIESEYVVKEVVKVVDI